MRDETTQAGYKLPRAFYDRPALAVARGVLALVPVTNVTRVNTVRHPERMAFSSIAQSSALLLSIQSVGSGNCISMDAMTFHS